MTGISKSVAKEPGSRDSLGPKLTHIDACFCHVENPCDYGSGTNLCVANRWRFGVNDLGFETYVSVALKTPAIVRVRTRKPREHSLFSRRFLFRNARMLMRVPVALPIPAI